MIRSPMGSTCRAGFCLVVAFAFSEAAIGETSFPLGNRTIVVEAASVSARDAAGKVLWKHAIRTPSIETPAPDMLLVWTNLQSMSDEDYPEDLGPREGALAFGSEWRALLRLDPATGKTLWVAPLYSKGEELKIVELAGSLYWANSDYLFRIDTGSGRVTARHWLSESITAVQRFDDAIRIRTNSKSENEEPSYTLRDGIITPKAFTGGNLLNWLRRIHEAQNACPGFAGGGMVSSFGSFLDLRRINLRRPNRSEIDRYGEIDLAAVALRYEALARNDPTNSFFDFYRGIALHLAGRTGESARLLEGVLRNDGRFPLRSAELGRVAWELERLSFTQLSVRAQQVFERLFFQEHPVIFDHQVLIANLIAYPMGRAARLRFSNSDVEQALYLVGRNRAVFPVVLDGDGMFSELLARWYREQGRADQAAEETRRAKRLSGDDLLDIAGNRRLGLDAAIVLAGLLAAALLTVELLARSARTRGGATASLSFRLGLLLIVEAAWMISADSNAASVAGATLLAVRFVPPFRRRVLPNRAGRFRIILTHLALGALALAIASLLARVPTFEGWFTRLSMVLLLVLVSLALALTLAIEADRRREASAVKADARGGQHFRDSLPEIFAVLVWGVALAATRDWEMGFGFAGAIACLVLAWRVKTYGNVGMWPRLIIVAVLPIVSSSMAGELVFSRLDVVDLVGWRIDRAHLYHSLAAATAGACGLGFALWNLWSWRTRSRPSSSLPALTISWLLCWFLILVAATHAIWTGFWFPTFAAFDRPVHFFLEPAHGDWLADVTRARAVLEGRRFFLAPPGVATKARMTLAWAEGVSRQLRGETKEAAAAYRDCGSWAPCTANLAMLESASLPKQELVSRFDAASRLPGDRSAPLYNLGVLRGDERLVAEAEQLDPFRVGAARRHRPAQLLIAAPRDVDLVLAVRCGEANLGNIFKVGLDRIGEVFEIPGVRE